MIKQVYESACFFNCKHLAFHVGISKNHDGGHAGGFEAYAPATVRVVAFMGDIKMDALKAVGMFGVLFFHGCNNCRCYSGFV